MKILALDTATENCSAALLIDEELRGREELLASGHAAERILPMVDGLLAEAGLRLQDLTAIAFGRGPGAFTGVRLAASVTQGLACGARLPVIPVSDLRAIAQRALELPAAPPRTLVCSDARMREVYWACFERGPAGLASAVTAERVGPAASVSLPESWLSGGMSHGVAGAGSGFPAYPELAASLPSLATVEGSLLPRATEIARLGRAEALAGRLQAPQQALPVYLRDDVAKPSPVGH